MPARADEAQQHDVLRLLADGVEPDALADRLDVDGSVIREALDALVDQEWIETALNIGGFVGQRARCELTKSGHAALRSPLETRVGRTERYEANEILHQKVEALAASSWQQLDAYESRVEKVVSPSGRRFEVRTATFWDADEWASGLYVVAETRPVPSRWRRRWRYRVERIRGGPGDPIPVVAAQQDPGPLDPSW